ncbi:hypothetical protein C0Q70_09653 [Pomacea canaliculata]|uniref:Uncharacterized protein n=1 Tax=Pomacea canaliculata TaxID=400727 RepID=A0A2T7PAE0_POMCA|nr:hypothetical protein C0Q70_09653 [Pomacea canaliculata]
MYSDGGENNKAASTLSSPISLWNAALVAKKRLPLKLLRHTTPSASPPPQPLPPPTPLLPLPQLPLPPPLPIPPPPPQNGIMVHHTHSQVTKASKLIQGCMSGDGRSCRSLQCQHTVGKV